MRSRKHSVSVEAILPLLLLTVFFVVLDGCTDRCQVTNQYVYYEPVYKTSAQIREVVAQISPRAIANPGKIYFKDGWLFINEPDSGIHIIDNRNPENPINVSFLNLPGSRDLAIKGNTLYADSYIDLVLFDISNLAQIKEVSRLEGVFSHVMFSGFYYDEVKGVVTDFKEVSTVNITESECNMFVQPWGGIYYEAGVAFLASMDSRSATAQLTAAPTQAGIGGSMARFTISDNSLYALDGSDLRVIDVTQPFVAGQKGSVPLSWDVETLFPYNDHLFVGSQTGMYILSLDSDLPEQIAKYEHVRSCDPVVVEGNHAFVTLRDGTTCGGFTNQLEVIDITNLTAPTLLHVYPMTHPLGLGIDDGTLFICDDQAGLRIFDATDVSKISQKQLAHYSAIQAFDVIPFQHVAMVIGSDGLYQYDYSDISQIKLISQIPILRQ